MIVLANLLTFFLLAAAQQPTGADLRGFTGKWEARFKDSVICLIELRSGERLSGAMSECRINVDAEGNLTEPGPPDSSPEPARILNATIVDGVLTFECKDGDGDEPTSFAMKLIRDGVAELQVTNAPVRIKPIRFVRIAEAK